MGPPRRHGFFGKVAKVLHKEDRINRTIPAAKKQVTSLGSRRKLRGQSEVLCGEHEVAISEVSEARPQRSKPVGLEENMKILRIWDIRRRCGLDTETDEMEERKMREATIHEGVRKPGGKGGES